MFGLRFQPIVDAWDRSIIGYESTIHGCAGEPAAVMFQRAEASGTVVELDAEAIRQSIAEGLTLLDGRQQLFINVHPKTFHSGISWWDCLPVNRVIIEMTERTRLHPEMRDQFVALQEAGVQFAIDDYGKRDSNLDRLILDWFHPVYIKLDKEFTSRLTLSRTAGIIKNTVRLCQDTGLKLIVEGVESQQQKEILLDIGVRYMQGYYFGMPEARAVIQKRLESEVGRERGLLPTAGKGGDDR